MSNIFGNTPIPGRFDKVEKADLTGVQQAAVRADSRDRELTRRFERAEDMRRKDLNSAADFDIASIGQFGQEIFQQEVDEVRELIASGQLDPTQARAKIGELKGLYGQFSQHADSMSEKDAEAKGLIDNPQSRAAYEKKMGIGEELSYGADDYAVQHNLSMNGVFEKGSAQKVNGQWTVVDPNTGQRVPFSQVTGFADPNHFFKYGTKALDVGTLDDWAKSKSTSTAIGFKNGQWDETRARNTYRDNVLTTDDIGRTHRLQLLGTLEDRGLVDHLTDEEKRQFRDGENLASDKFREVIEKGEDEFVERSKFDVMPGAKSGKGGSGGSGGSSEDKDDIVAGGMSVPPQVASGYVKNMSEEDKRTFGTTLASTGATMGHTLNRFKKGSIPEITGSFMLPNYPNTQKISIHAVGVNEIGQRVAYIIGTKKVEKPNPLGPEFPSTSSEEEFDMEIVIGKDQEGVGSDIYQEIYQKHPKMAALVEADRNAGFDSSVKSMKEDKPKEEQAVDVPSAQQDQIDRYDALKERRDEILNDPNPVSREGNLEAERIQEEMDVLLNDKALSDILKERDSEESKRLNEGIASVNKAQQSPDESKVEPEAPNESRAEPEDPFQKIEDMAAEQSEVIANAPDEIKDQITAKINEARPEKIYAYETENSAGEKAIGFRNEVGEDVGDLIFFT